MNAFPVLQRELTVATRRRGTYRIRSISAMIAILVLMAVLPFAALINVSAGFGKGLFVFLASYALLIAIVSGPFITANALSTEREEGTLGLLFLTDLGSGDIVIGKFFANALNPLYALLAIFPTLAIPMLFGGVTVGEFWRVVLVLMVTLYFSLSLGMLVSAVSTSSRQVTAKSFLLLACLSGVPFALLPLANSAGNSGSLFFHYLASVSPIYSFIAATSTKPGVVGVFWAGIVFLSLAGSILLVAAAYLLPRSFQRGETITGGENVSASERRALSQGANPIEWLLYRGSRATTRLTWCFSAGAVIFAGLTVSSGDLGTVVHYGKIVMHWALKLLVAVEASRFFRESRKSGAWELLVCTPLDNSQIIRGLMAALRRRFLLPLVIVSLFELMMAVVLASTGGVRLLGLVQLVGIVDLVAGAMFLASLSVVLSVRLQKPEFTPALVLGIGLLIEVLFCVPNLAIYLIGIPVCRDILRRDLRREIATRHYGETHRRALR
jgi:ABC-type transport system involved in multi-copper enzyme maturation permease subunit